MSTSNIIYYKRNLRILIFISELLGFVWVQYRCTFFTTTLRKLEYYTFCKFYIVPFSGMNEYAYYFNSLKMKFTATVSICVWYLHPHNISNLLLLLCMTVVWEILFSVNGMTWPPCVCERITTHVVCEDLLRGSFKILEEKG